MFSSKLFPVSLGALALIALSLALVAAPATAKKKSGFKTGVYKVSGDYKVSFFVKKGTCVPWGGKKAKKGYCYSFYDFTKTAMDCPDGAGNQPDYEDYVILPYNTLLPKSGKVNLTLKTMYASGEEAASTDLSFKLSKKGKGSGSIEKVAKTTYGPPTTCTSGKLNFSLKR